MSIGKIYHELEELCHYDYEEMQRTLNTLRDMLNDSKELEESGDQE